MRESSSPCSRTIAVDIDSLSNCRFVHVSLATIYRLMGPQASQQASNSWSRASTMFYSSIDSGEGAGKKLGLNSPRLAQSEINKSTMLCRPIEIYVYKSRIGGFRLSVNHVDSVYAVPHLDCDKHVHAFNVDPQFDFKFNGLGVL